jgi:putative DNA methylase
MRRDRVLLSASTGILYAHTSMPVNTPDILLERVRWTDVDELVRVQQRSRENYSPGISVFRWWARRPHALIGALLDAAAEDDRKLTVADPFSGGGTVAMEAARRGFEVYAQDLHPWAAEGLAATLDGVDPDELDEAAGRWLRALSDTREKLYGTSCARHGAGEVGHTFWTRESSCVRCDRPIFLFPYSLVTLDSRRTGETHAWFGCRACGHVTRSALAANNRRCGRCRRPLESPNEPLLEGGDAPCPHPNCDAQAPAFRSPATWTPVLVQRHCKEDGRRVTHFSRPSGSELAAATVSNPDLPAALLAEIPDGLETRRLRRAGILTWADLYPSRQLQTLLAAHDAVSRLGASAAVKARLRIVVSGAAEMAGYASRWDRYYPKAFEAMANHRFGLTGFACETNLLCDSGRGTLPRRVRHSVRAARWAAAPAAHVVRGSSTRQLLPDGAVDLVLTDPPYFDDVQYAELASLFLTWAQVTGLIAATVRVDLRSEAVANASRSAGVPQYRTLLTRIFRETRRTLRDDGRMVLTFHNSDGRAWWALARALTDSGYSVVALAVAHAENGSDHAKRGRRAFTRDLVLECVPQATEGAVRVTPEVAGEVAELLAAGAAVAEVGSPAGQELAESYEAFGHCIRRHLGHEPTLIALPKTPQRARR